jgi:3-phosphoshikimate 1-carboxyvinyltransferase
MRRIRTLPAPKTVEVAVPGSKSYTHRMIVAAALSDGRCTIANALDSEDTRLTLDTLQRWGVSVGLDGTSMTVFGANGRLQASAEPIFLGNSGTSMRLLTAVAALAQGRSLLTGTDRLQARPMRELLEALGRLGVNARSLGAGGCPPIEVEGGTVAGGATEMDCALSSQFLSALLLIGPYAREGVEIGVTRGPVSRPYIDITLDTMRRFGVEVERRGYDWFKVAGGQCYRAGDHLVEADCSQAGYFWAAAAVTGSTVKVRRTASSSCQGDARLAEVLAHMGCTVTAYPDGLSVSGGPLTGVEVDMGDMPDAVPTLAVVAAFASGRTVIRGVGHLKEKESNRLAAVCSELRRLGIQAVHDTETLWIVGGSPRGAAIACHDDHRIAMSFAVAGLAIPGVEILDETCVRKSFPTFWDVFEAFYR